MRLLCFAWQLPQHLLALALLLLWRRVRVPQVCAGFVVIRLGPGFPGLCLGRYIFVGEPVSRRIIKHEIGHSRQSRLLGPLYLLIIGLPSLCLYLWDRRMHKGWEAEERERWYYGKWPESWADRLGGVK